MGASASINSIIEEEKLKPIDASDVKAESAKEEVIRLRKILHESKCSNYGSIWGNIY